MRVIKEIFIDVVAYVDLVTLLHPAVTSMNYVRLCNSLLDVGNRETIFTLILNLNTSLCNRARRHRSPFAQASSST